MGKVAGAKLTTGSNNIDIGNQGRPGDSNTIWIGARAVHRNTYIAGISGVTVAEGVGVVVDRNGHLGTITSSRRYKEAIKPLKEASAAILSLKPVTFRYQTDLDPEAIPQFGLIAEDGIWPAFFIPCHQIGIDFGHFGSLRGDGGKSERTAGGTGASAAARPDSLG